ncbi:MAG TPA: alpha/beta fold hydrolase [Caulobacteraceae bacterium]|jgi:pimeloyl-ACP methyl ester carboxylesterase|nr:alpha/beta fold hydrolase [Caulobacteraceae bacterium]
MRALLFALIAFAVPVIARAAPCVTATASCERWIELKPGERAMAYATRRLDQPDPTVRRALIMVHGTLRNADHYFATATTAGFLDGALDDTVIIAPAFHSADPHCDDKLAPGEVSFSCTGDSWRSGGAASSDPKLTSFDFADVLLRRLADKRLFPNLEVIVVAGHSAGGQFVARYAMASRVADDLGVPVRFVVANPSSYAWPDATRLIPKGVGSPVAAAAAWKDERPHTGFRFGLFDAAKVAGYDTWPYGLEDRTGGYTAGMSDDLLRRNLAHRDVTYLLSQVDTLPLGGFDDSPRAMAQGATRRQRGEAFVQHIRESLGAKAPVIIVPECGHNDRCVYTTDQVLPAIFPPVQ